MRRCVFLTMDQPDGFYIYDDLVSEPMASRGWQVETVPWTTSTTCWDDCDLVVIRSTWDYQNDVARFLKALEEIDRSHARLENHLEVVRWNIHKTYLRDLEERGVPVVPTLWTTGLDPHRWSKLKDECGTERVVVKPVIGANADDTFRLENSAELRVAHNVLRDREVMVQPYLETIETVGEYSLFYFGGTYSHTVLKRPRSGDFRVQEEHGGIVRTATPDEDMLSVGAQAVEAIGTQVLYARVDLVRLEGGKGIALMELELIEPSLYFPFDPLSPERFAEAVERLW